jgi:hypothetical protein
MNKRSWSLALLLSWCLALSAAGGDEKPTGSWYPLQVGATWHYKAGAKRFSLRVARYEKFAKVQCARVELIQDKKVTSFEHVAADAKAVKRFSLEGKEARPPIVVLKLPPKKGQSWKVDSKADGQTLKGTFRVGEVEEVKVPAGTFKALTVTSEDLEANGLKMKITFYYADKVGLVKEVIQTGKQKIVVELEKFEPGKE